jgi:hypothetical protein
MAYFPITSLLNKQDSGKFGFEQEDVGIRSEMEGGYVLTRPRSTRTPRRTWLTGFTDISNEDKLLLEDFFNEHGTYLEFTYIVPVPDTLGGSNEEVQCRFSEKFVWEYKGFGTNARWNVSMKIEEV